MRHILSKFPSLVFVSEGVGANYKAVTKWYERDSIPPKYDLRLIALAKSADVALTLEDIAAARAGATNETGAA